MQNINRTESRPLELSAISKTTEDLNRWLLDSLDLVVSLEKTFQTGLKQPWDAENIILQTKPILRRLVDFQAMAFLTVNEEDRDFQLVDCEPGRKSNLIEAELEHQIEGGIFAWCLYQNRPVIVYSKNPKQRTMLHVLATKRKIVGMFLGILDNSAQFVPDAVQKLISIILLSCAKGLEHSILYNELNDNTLELEKTNLALKQEITERKLFENQLVQAQKLESIGQLAAGIAHEINTPTQYVGDNTRFLRDSYSEIVTLLDKYRYLLKSLKKGKLSEKFMNEILDFEDEIDVKYLLEEIPAAISQSLAGIDRVTEIVAAIKEFSHPGVKEKKPIDINKAIESAITVSRNEWKYVADMIIDFDPELPPVPCLPGELNQVILNIIINAADVIAEDTESTPDGKGTITVSTRHSKEWAEIHISDTGAGIPEQIQPRIFDPFFTTKEVGKGTGQGLAIAHDVIVEKHCGTIDFETEMGIGTTFTIRLPIHSENYIK